MKNLIILYVRTGSEEKLLSLLKKNLNTEEYFPFCPVKETPYRRKGVINKNRKHLFPGYIFIQTNIEACSISEKLGLTLMKISQHKNIYKLLHYGEDKKDVVVREKERRNWERLFDSNFCITGSVGFIEGEKIRVTSGALVGMESRITKINRHKREAVVEIEMMGAVRKVTLMLEVITKI